MVLVSNIVHSETETTCRTLLKKIFDALLPGGRIVLKDYFLAASRTQPAAGAIFSVQMLLFTCYTFDEVKRWLGETGFTLIRQIPLGEAWPQSLVVAQRS